MWDEGASSLDPMVTSLAVKGWSLLPGPDYTVLCPLLAPGWTRWLMGNERGGVSHLGLVVLF